MTVHIENLHRVTELDLDLYRYSKIASTDNSIPDISPRKVSPLTKHGFTKYTVDANLFPLESSILTRAKRATNRKNRGGNCPWGNNPGGNCLWEEITGWEMSGREFSMGEVPGGENAEGTCPGGEVS